MLRLTRYYAAEGDSLHEIEVWDRYRGFFPNDPRGYQNEITALILRTPNDYSRRAIIYNAWMRIDPANNTLRTLYAGFCISAGNYYFSQVQLDSARSYYESAIALDSKFPKAYNNLGSVFAQQGNIAKAIEFFQKAIALDPVYPEAYYNLGNAYTDAGDTRKGREHLKSAARLNNQPAQQLLRRREPTIPSQAPR